MNTKLKSQLEDLSIMHSQLLKLEDSTSAPSTVLGSPDNHLKLFDNGGHGEIRSSIHYELMAIGMDATRAAIEKIQAKIIKLCREIADEPLQDNIQLVAGKAQW